ncbi:MAG: methionine--tRNA ligase [Alphaproteobacteria bacterium]|nr:methionine--tRNA ligase [Alphaproteobacteria bacterium]
MAKTPFYITTAISYVNGSPHLGHAYEAILTDVMARFKRLDGYDVMFLTGTDEHGEKVAKTAEQNGMKPKEFADKNAAEFQAMTKLLGISNDDFIRTTEERHHIASQAIWKRLQDNGDIYLGKYKGWYSIREEGYFTEDELTKIPETGEYLTPNGTEAKWVEEESYFFKLSEYTDKLLTYYEDHPEFIQPESRRNEIISFVKGGLKDLSISRHKDRLNWGIPVPEDKNHIMYVWLDALTNYITGVNFPDESSENFKKFWPADYHVIGKDIIRFHAVYWPAFLISAGLDIPKTIFAHGFINVQGQKMSKSVGNVLSPIDMIDTYGLEQIRYFLMREISHGQDGNFSHEQAIERMNADLANGIGNLAQRTLSMIYKNCNSQIPEHGEFTEQDNALMNQGYEKLLESLRQHTDKFEYNIVIESIMSLARNADKYIDTQAPWILKKEDPKRMETVLYVLSEVIRCIAISIQFITPDAAGKILDQINVSESNRLFKHLSADYSLKAGTNINKPYGVFPRIVEDEQMQKVSE